MASLLCSETHDDLPLVYRMHWLSQLNVVLNVVPPLPCLPTGNNRIRIIDHELVTSHSHTDEEIKSITFSQAWCNTSSKGVEGNPAVKQFLNASVENHWEVLHVHIAGSILHLGLYSSKTIGYVRLEAATSR